MQLFSIRLYSLKEQQLKKGNKKEAEGRPRTFYFAASWLKSQKEVVYSGGGLVAKLFPSLVTAWTVACQAHLSMGFPRQECWIGISFSLYIYLMFNIYLYIFT